MQACVWLGVCVAYLAASCSAKELPTFAVPGYEYEMRLLNSLHHLHHEQAFSDCTLWDAWLPHATLWTGPEAAQRYRNSFLRRRIDASGYVSMQQHRGMAHSEGWPFPAWQQSGGIGWHFSTQHEVWAIQHFGLKALNSVEGWQIRGAEVLGIDSAVGLQLRATEDVVTIQTPAFRCGTIVAPFVRLEWSSMGLAADSRPHVNWLLNGEPDWSETRRVDFPVHRSDAEMQFTNIPLYRQAEYSGLLNRYQFQFDKAAGAQLNFKSIITAIDTRHPITNSLYLRGCTEHFAWTGDVVFLRANVARMRLALQFLIDEFSVRQFKHVRVPWVGHDGQSGLMIDAAGVKSTRPGVGVGNNYWDLLPFGGQDALATIYLIDALQRFLELERAIESHPEWELPGPEVGFTVEQLTQLLEDVRSDFRRRFWSSESGRFVGWIDGSGRTYDYGFTFVNLEAIASGAATAEQALKIMEWLDGDREIESDTSRGADIYHWRFAPRATTRRNTEAYVWVWSGPEQIPWGGQVQDGGAVLGFSYFDLMARLRSKDPQDAWHRLKGILSWFDEVQQSGGYRSYYAQPGRGTLQGGGTAGGLGIDHEFFESVLVPQVMLYGFMGLQPTPEGCRVRPRLPDDWPSLTITDVHLQGYVLDITAYHDGRIQIRISESGAASMVIKGYDGDYQIDPGDVGRMLEFEPAT